MTDIDWATYDLTDEENLEGSRIFCAAMAEIGVHMEPTETGNVTYTYVPEEAVYLRAVNLVQARFGKPAYRDIDELDAFCKWKGLK